MRNFVFISTTAAAARDIAAARPSVGTAVSLLVADGLGTRIVDGIDVIDVGEISARGWRHRWEALVWGRMLLRLSPLDGGAQLRRRIQRSPEARRTLSSANVVVAATRDAILTAWTVTRRQPSTTGLNGLGAGLAVLGGQ